MPGLVVLPAPEGEVARRERQGNTVVFVVSVRHTTGLRVLLGGRHGLNVQGESIQVENPNG